MKILIADRSYEIRNRLKNLVLEIYNNSKIYETSSNTDAMSIVKTQKPNVVITDIDLQNGSGLRLLSLMKTINSPSLKIVFTNHVKYGLEEISKKLGADYFLCKAHDFIEIKRILKNKTSDSNNNRAN